MRIEAYIQARMGSKRLPGKVLKEVLDKPLLEFLMERLSRAKEIDCCVILTTDQPSDDCIASFCKQRGISVFRGSEKDVLARYYQAAVERKPDGIVRITADCPLIDSDIVDQVITLFRQQELGGANYVSNTLERTYPKGLDVEVFSFQALKAAYRDAVDPAEREHVTLYMYRHPEQFLLKNLACFPSLAAHRWTVDTPEDFALIQLILKYLYPRKPHFQITDILDFLEFHQDMLPIDDAP